MGNYSDNVPERIYHTMTPTTYETLPERLRERLAAPLPGQPAQYKMASLRRMEELGVRSAPPPDVKVACVLLLLHRQPDDDLWRMVFIQRSENPHDRHSGQISFPGGRYEENDGDLVNVALREAHEEVGIPPEQVTILGRLTELYIPVSNFVVHPFVGVLEGAPIFVPQPGEVAHILTPPLHIFTDTDSQKTTDMTVGAGILLKNVPYFDLEGRVLWGATAMMLNEFLEVVG